MTTGAATGAGFPSTTSCPPISQPVSPPADPRPQPPEEPGPNECCGSGCPLCVLDLYSEDLQRYRAALAAWKLRHPDADE
ncbi:MAG TPA: oxidoreductase-like protein [Stenotrophomonas sp.]|nr:oxidoreductase-like protein [Stenotrophomonas sp.]